MGIYRRENGIFYLKAKVENSYKRISLNTRDYKLAQRMYDNYLLNEIDKKLNPPKSVNITQKQNNTEKCYIEYIELCQSQKRTAKQRTP